MHSNVTIKNVSWPHFSWPTLYVDSCFMTCVCDRATLDLNVRHMNSEMSSLNEQQVRQLREKDTELRRLKKTTLQLKIARDGLRLVEQTQENKKAEVSHRLLFVHRHSQGGCRGADAPQGWDTSRFVQFAGSRCSC